MIYPKNILTLAVSISVTVRGGNRGRSDISGRCSNSSDSWQLAGGNSNGRGTSLVRK